MTTYKKVGRYVDPQGITESLMRACKIYYITTNHLGGVVKEAKDGVMAFSDHVLIYDNANGEEIRCFYMKSQHHLWYIYMNEKGDVTKVCEYEEAKAYGG